MSSKMKIARGAYVSGECLGVSKLYGTHLLCARQQRVKGALHLPVM